MTQLDEIVQELDMLVYRLEGDPEKAAEWQRDERRAVRRELEQLRDRLWQMVRGA